MERIVRLNIIAIFLFGFLHAVSAQARTFTKDDNFVYVDGKKVFIKGITYAPSYPGEVHSDRSRKADVKKDMRMIKEAGANTILLYWIWDEKIYRAARNAGLYILQGMPIEQDPPDFHDPKFKKRLKQRITYMVDTIHDHRGSDYSDIILAYWLGGEFTEGAVLTAGRVYKDMEPYKGAFVQAQPYAHPVESFLAEIADFLKEYESKTYKRTTWVSHINWPITDQILNTGSFLDLALFDVYSHWPARVFSYPSGDISGTSYQGYLQDLKRQYEKTPLIISEFGFASAPENETSSGSHETEQAISLLGNWADIVTASPPLAGGLVFEWNDEWWKHSPAVEVVNLTRDRLSHDPTDPEEWFGIISIDGRLSNYQVRPKPAYHAVSWMYSEDFDPTEYISKNKTHTRLFKRFAHETIPMQWAPAWAFTTEKNAEQAWNAVGKHADSKGVRPHLFVRMNPTEPGHKKAASQWRKVSQKAHDQGLVIHGIGGPKDDLADAKDLYGFDSWVMKAEGLDDVQIEALKERVTQRGSKKGEGTQAFGLEVNSNIADDKLIRMAEHCDYVLVNPVFEKTKPEEQVDMGRRVKEIVKEIDRISAITCRYNTKVILRASTGIPQDRLDAVVEKLRNNLAFSGVAAPLD